MVKKGTRPVISYPEMDILISSFKGKRDRALIAIMYWSGRRVGEVVALERLDITKHSVGYIMASFRLSKTKIDKVIGTPIPLGNPITKHFIEYIEWFDKRNIKGRLFNISPGRVGQIVKERDPTISPHWFRHCRATHLGKVMNIWELCSYFGWKKIETALIYTHTSPEFILNKMLELEVVHDN